MNTLTPPAPVTSHSESSSTSEQNARSTTLLVIEDDEVLSKVLRQILSEGGYVVRTAVTSGKALEEIDACEPDLVLLDISLRDGKGRELAETLRVQYSDTPTILLTPYPRSEADFPSWPRESLITKSIDLPDLRRSVATALARRSSQSAARPIEVEPTLRLPHQNNVPAARSVQEPLMRSSVSKLFKAVAVLLFVALIVVGFAAANGTIHLPGTQQTAAEDSAAPSVPEPTVELVEGKAHTLMVPPTIRTSLGARRDNVDLIAVAKKPLRTRALEMPGTLTVDPTRLLRVRALFAPSPSSAQVVEIGRIAEDPRATGKGRTVYREVRSGDRVSQGDLLAVFRSVDVGNKKNDLIDSIYQLKLDEPVLKHAEAHADAVPQIFLMQARQKVQADVNSYNRALSTLRTWGISEEDIQAVRDEAEKVKPEEAERRLRNHNKADFERWARVEVRAPEDGLIVERNVSLHEPIVDNSTNLFQIAKLDPGEAGPKMIVVANVPEDDLPILEALQEHSAERIRWTISIVGSPPIRGYIDDIGWFIDPNQHTAVVKGHIDNREGHFRSGEFISATVEIPPPVDVVELPSDAVVEDGQQSVVFVENANAKDEYTMHRVEVMNRFDKVLFIRSRPFHKGEEITAEEKELDMLPREALLPGTRVLGSGVAELKAVLADRESRVHSSTDQAKPSVPPDKHAVAAHSDRQQPSGAHAKGSPSAETRAD